MKTLLHYIPFISIAVLLSSCHPEDIKPPVNNDPVFTSHVTIDGSSYEISAGVEDASLSTFVDEVNGVKKFSGKLGTSNDFINFGIMSGNLDMLSPYSVDNFSGALKFIANQSTPIFHIDKDDFENEDLINYISWKVNGEFVGNNAFSISEPGIYQVCGEVHFYQGAVKTVCNEIIVGYNSHADAEMHHLVGLDNVLKAWISPKKTKVAQVEWSVDGVVVSNESSLSYQLSDGQHLVEAQIIFQNGAFRKKQILVDADDLGLFLSDFSSFDLSSTVSWDFGADMTIQHEGKTYKTIGADNTQSSIEVTDIEYFGKNSQGKDVYKCTGSITAFAKEMGSGNIVPIQIETVFGIPLD